MRFSSCAGSRRGRGGAGAEKKDQVRQSFSFSINTGMGGVGRGKMRTDGMGSDWAGWIGSLGVPDPWLLVLEPTSQSAIGGVRRKLFSV